MRWDAFNRKRDAIAREQERLKLTWLGPRNLPDCDAARVLGKPLERDYCLMDLLKRPDVTYASLMTLPGIGPGTTDGDVADQVEIQIKYQGYITRQQDEVARSERYEAMPLPRDLDYGNVRGLSIEVQQKLSQHRPETIGSRISGSRAAISAAVYQTASVRPQNRATKSRHEYCHDEQALLSPQTFGERLGRIMFADC
jgi:tRNA uridine 5-carboxymethylaminomethyl modification enzyme